MTHNHIIILYMFLSTSNFLPSKRSFVSLGLISLGKQIVSLISGSLCLRNLEYFWLISKNDLMYPWYTIKMSRLEDRDLCKKNMDFESIIVSFFKYIGGCFLDACSFLKGNRGKVDLGERGCAGRSGGKETMVYCIEYIA